MNKKPDELYEVVSLRPTELETLRPIRHVAYKHTKASCDEYVAWLGATQYNRGTVESVTRYLRAGSPLTPSMDRETALGYLNIYLDRTGVLSSGIRYPDELQYVRWIQTFGSTAGPFGGIGGQAATNFLMEAWVWDNFAVVFCGGKRIKITDNFSLGARY